MNKFLRKITLISSLLLSFTISYQDTKVNLEASTGIIGVNPIDTEGYVFGYNTSGKYTSTICDSAVNAFRLNAYYASSNNFDYGFYFKSKSILIAKNTGIGARPLASAGIRARGFDISTSIGKTVCLDKVKHSHYIGNNHGHLTVSLSGIFIYDKYSQNRKIKTKATSWNSSRAIDVGIGAVAEANIYSSSKYIAISPSIEAYISVWNTSRFEGYSLVSSELVKKALSFPRDKRIIIRVSVPTRTKINRYTNLIFSVAGTFVPRTTKSGSTMALSGLRTLIENKVDLFVGIGIEYTY